MGMRQISKRVYQHWAKKDSEKSRTSSVRARCNDDPESMDMKDTAAQSTSANLLETKDSPDQACSGSKVDIWRGSPSPDTWDSTPTLGEDELWDEAYDALKHEEAQIVDRYERLLTRQLLGNCGSTELIPQKNVIAQDDPKKRQTQMNQLVQSGLQHVDKETKWKKSFEDKTQILSCIKSMIDGVVKSSTEASLAWVGISCVLQILANPISETSENREGIAYIISRMKWYNRLSKKVIQTSPLEGPNSGLRDELKTHVVDLYKLLLLYQMKSVCSYYRNRGVAFLGDLLALDNWTDTIKHVKDAETVVQRDIDTYSNETIKSQLECLAVSAKALEENLCSTFQQALRGQTMTLREMRQDEKNDKCLSDLLSANPPIPDPRDDINRIEQTKGGLLDVISHEWIICHPDIHQLHNTDLHRLLWIKGAPGKGKTMFLISMIKNWDKLSNNKPPAYFFCQGNSNMTSAVAVLRGLIFCLISQCPELISYLREKYDHRKGLFEDDSSFYVLSGVLEAMFCDPNLGKAYIVIDALDECDTDQKQLLNLIVRNIKSSSKVKWIVSSRDLPHIEDGLSAGNLDMQIHLDLGDKKNEKQVSRAVSAYITTRLANIRSLKNDADLGARAEAIIHDKAEGTFLWAHLVVEELGRVEAYDVPEVLEEMPPGLDGVYHKILSRIQDSRRQNPEFCHKVLSAAALSHRPLCLSEIAGVSGLPKKISSKPEHLKRILSMCSSFIKIQEDSAHFIHLSAREYLINNAKSTVFLSGIPDAHRGMFLRSIEAMTAGLRQNIYNLKSFGPQLGGIVSPDPDPLAALRYSCIYWVDHLCDACHDDAKPQDVMENFVIVQRFLSSKVLHWVEALCCMGALSDGISATEKLQVLVEAFSGDSELLELVRDIHRFVSQFGILIKDAPLQLYISGLLFAPAESSIRKFFGNTKAANWALTKPIVGDTWSPLIKTIVPNLCRDDSYIPLMNIVTNDPTLVDFGLPNSPWIRRVAFSRDSMLIASGLSNGVVQIWEAATGSLRHTLHGHLNQSVYALAFSHNSSLLATKLVDGTVEIWETKHGILKKSLETTGRMDLVAFSHDSKLFASEVDDETIKIWDTETWKVETTVRGSFATFSQDSGLLASAWSDESKTIVEVWATESWSQVEMFERHFDDPHAIIMSMSFFYQSKPLVVMSLNFHRKLQIWDTMDRDRIKSFITQDRNTVACFSRHSKIMASASNYGNIQLLDPIVGSLEQILEHEAGVCSLSFSDSNLLASVSDSAIKIWDTNAKALDHPQKKRAPIQSTTISPDMMFIASESRNSIKTRMIKIWNLATGSLKLSLERDSSTSADSVFSADSMFFAIETSRGYIQIWNTATWAHVHGFQAHEEDINSLVFSQDSRLLASVSHQRTRVWCPRSGLEMMSTDTRANAAAFSHDSKLLALGSNSLEIWNMSADNPTRRFPAPSTYIQALAFSQDSRFLAAASEEWGVNPAIHIWDITTERLIQTFSIVANVSTIKFGATNSFIDTNFGRVEVNLNTNKPNSSHTTEAQNVTQTARYLGYYLSPDMEWIERDGEKIMWLPPGYRPQAGPIFAVLESLGVTTLSIGCQSGKVITMRLPATGPLEMGS